MPRSILSGGRITVADEDTHKKTKQRKTVIFICAKSTSRPTTHVPVSTRQLQEEEVVVVVVVVVQRLRFSFRVVCANYFREAQKNRNIQMLLSSCYSK